MDEQARLPRLPRRPWILLLVAAVAVCTLLAFGHSLSQGFAPIDDSFLVQQNLAVRGVTAQSLRLAFTTFDPELYIPLTLVSFQLDFLLHGLDPLVFHATNLFLHTLNALLVMWLLLLLTRRRWPSLLGGLLFAVHPLHTEAVVWIAGRKDLLAAFFLLASFIAYLYARRGHRRLFFGSGIAFTAALLSKVTAVVLVPLLFVDDWLHGSVRHKRWLWLEKLPFLLISIPFITLALGGKQRVLTESSPLAAAALAGKSILFYLSKFLLPVHLSVFYPQTGPLSFASAELAGCWAVLFILCLVALRVQRRAPLGIAGVFFFLCALAPTLLHYERGGSIFFAVDRYAYVASIGLFITCIGMVEALRPWIASWPREVPWVLSTVLVVACIVLSMHQTLVWDSPRSLFGNALSLYPSSVDARIALATVQRETGDTQGAFDTLREGLSYGDDARLHFQVAYVYAATGEASSAREQLQEAIRLAPTNPDPVYALGTLAEQAGDSAGALQQYEQAASIDDSFVAAQVSAAILLLRQGQMDAAERHLRTALQWNPSSIDALIAYAQLYIQNGRSDLARQQLSQVLLLDPQNQQALDLSTRLPVQK